MPDRPGARSALPWLLGLGLATGAARLALSANAAGDRLPPAWDTWSDTWVATDGLGRKVPLASEVGGLRPGRQVGVFYFLWLGRHGEAGPFDISRILATDPTALEKPDSPLWGPLGVPHHWGESVFGYYVGEDESVLRKHAHMLANAGVDAVVFDVTNQLTYPESWQALGRVFDDVRRAGHRVPSFAFLCPFWDPGKVVRELYAQLYRPGLYPELWYRWEGRPLLLADPDLLGGANEYGRRDQPVRLTAGTVLGQTFRTDRPLIAVAAALPTWEARDAAVTLALMRNEPGGEIVGRRRILEVVDNAWASLEFTPPLPPGDYRLELSDPSSTVGWWSQAQESMPGTQATVNGTAVAGGRTLRLRFPGDGEEEIRNFFTFRKPQPDYFRGPTGPNQWGWLEVYPQHRFTNQAGLTEQMTVGVAQNAVDGRLSVLSNPRAHGRSYHAGRQPGPEGQDPTGHNVREQWSRALTVDPPFIFLTGWNEWIAGRFDVNSPFYGDGPVTFVDQFSPEYSRDIEPMKGGHGDVYYYQMVDYIRRYKGARPPEAIRPGPIRIDGRFADWMAVGPEFRDAVGDPVQRDARGWGQGTHYVNHTGRNDLKMAKVSADRRTVSFYVSTDQPLSPRTDPRWMLLLLDVDGNSTNGWLGYDYVVNRVAPGEKSAVLERHTGPGFAWGQPVPVPFRATGHELELALPRRALGLEPNLEFVDFKWADHLTLSGEPQDFTVNGDTAPDDRFNYRAWFKAPPPPAPTRPAPIPRNP